MTLAVLFVACTASAFAQPNVVMAVEPVWRVSSNGDPITTLVAMINLGDERADSCEIGYTNQYSGTEFFTITIENGVITENGPRNTRFTIQPGATQYAAVVFTPITPLPEQVTGASPSFLLRCSNTLTRPLPYLGTLNVLLSPEPRPDIIAAISTLTGDGIAAVTNDGGVTRAAVSALNIGAGDAEGSADAQIEARVRFYAHDPIGPRAARVRIPIDADICATNPATGQCLGDFAESVTTTIGDQPVSFAIRIRDSLETGVRFNPASARVAVEFSDATGAVVGLTTVAVATPWPDSREASPGSFAGHYRMLLRTSDGRLNEGGSSNAQFEDNLGFMLVMPSGEVWAMWLFDQESGFYRHYYLGQGQLDSGGDCGQQRACFSLGLAGDVARLGISAGASAPQISAFAGTLNGSAAVGSFLDGRFEFTQTPLSPSSIDWANVRTQYLRTSTANLDLAAYAGNYEVSSFTFQDYWVGSGSGDSHLNITAEGALTGSVYTVNGDCTIEGAISVPHENFNAFSGTLEFTNCEAHYRGVFEFVGVAIQPDRQGNGLPAFELLGRGPDGHDPFYLQAATPIE